MHTSIAEAKNHLPRLIHQVEAGDDVHITRHGKPVAVLVSVERYRQLHQHGKGLWQAIAEWRGQYAGCELEDEEVDGWRDRTPAREFAWD